MFGVNMRNFLNNELILKITSDILNYEKKSEALCNDVYLLNAKNGNFILKVAKRTIRQEELEKEVNIINFLKDKFNMPKILLFSNDIDCSFVLMEYIDGVKIKDFTDNILKEMARILKLIHNSVEVNEFVDFDGLLNIAKNNLINNRLDISEFIKHKNDCSPESVLNYLQDNKPKNVDKKRLHGDFRPKNMLIKGEDLYIFDYGLSFYGDIYYDLAIFKYYLSEEQFDKFVKYYGLTQLDEERLKYNELLSLFLNV